MNLAVKLLKFATKSTGIQKTLTKGLGNVKGFLKFGKDSAKILQKEFEMGARYYVPKPGVHFPACPKTLDLPNPVREITGKALKKDIMAQAELGNISLRLEKLFLQEKPGVERMLNKVFPGAEFSIRAKSSNSIFSKLKRVITEDKLVIATDAEARKIVKDSVGARITLPNLTARDFNEVINRAVINGKPLTASEKQMVTRYLTKSSDLSEAELKTAKSLAKEVKTLLAEKQVEPVYNNLMLGMMKDALNRNLTTIEKLEAFGINPKLLEQLRLNTGIEPFRVTKFCNYRGPQGVAYFSDRQINQIKKMQLATGEKFSIVTCDADIDLTKYKLKSLDKNAQDAIKKSGYTTAQMNFMTSDGHICELQISGKGIQKIYHPEHVKYDASQGKVTLGPLYNEYKSILKDMNKKSKMHYDKYFGDLYNSSRESEELLINTAKPQLDKSLNPALSIENLIKLGEQTKAMEAAEYATFKPHFIQSLDLVA